MNSTFATLKKVGVWVVMVVASQFASGAGLLVPDSVIVERDVEYSNPDGQHLCLNIARPKSGDVARPAILCIHGGGFRAGSRDGYNALCTRLVEQGYVAATVTYRLAPKYRFPEAIFDVKAAARWLRANAPRLRIDPSRIGVTGDSAGGHLAQFLGVTAGINEFEGDGGNPEQSSAVSCVVSKYGPSDLTKSYGKSVDAAEVLPPFLGGDLAVARPLHIRASPLNWVTPDAAPTLLLHGTEDPYVAFEQAVWMRDRLQACNVEVKLVAFDGAGHGFKGNDAQKADQDLIAFFDTHLKSK
jgi:acetyl esterase/lipase